MDKKNSLITPPELEEFILSYVDLLEDHQIGLINEHHNDLVQNNSIVQCATLLNNFYCLEELFKKVCFYKFNEFFRYLIFSRKDNNTQALELFYKKDSSNESWMISFRKDIRKKPISIFYYGSTYQKEINYHRLMIEWLFGSMHNVNPSLDRQNIIIRARLPSYKGNLDVIKFINNNLPDNLDSETSKDKFGHSAFLYLSN